MPIGNKESKKQRDETQNKLTFICNKVQDPGLFIPCTVLKYILC